MPDVNQMMVFLFFALRSITCLEARSGTVGWGTALLAASIPDGVVGIFHWHNPSVRTMASGLTQPLT